MVTPLVDIQGLSVAFNGVPVLRGVDLILQKGEAVGLVGESGSGKSVTWLAALGLLPRHARVSGSVRLDGREILGAPAAELDQVRGGRVAMIFRTPRARSIRCSPFAGSSARPWRCIAVYRAGR